MNFNWLFLLFPLRALSTDATSQLNVLGHDGHALGVDSTQVCIFKKANQVSLSSLLQSKDSRPLETKIGLEVLGDLANQTLEGQLADEQISTLLVTTNLTQCNGSRSVTVRLLDCGGR